MRSFRRKSVKGVLMPFLAVSIVFGMSRHTAAQNAKETDRLKEAATVLKEILGVPDDIPKDLLDRAECVIVFPSVKKFALGVGGSYGGARSCVGRVSNTAARGERRRCLRSKAEASASSSAVRRLISCCS
jgi:hypothetical protein